MELIDFLQITTGLAALLVKRPAGMVAALVFSGCAIAHNYLSASVSPLAYYTSAVMADSLALLILSTLRPVCLTVYALAWVCVVSMVLNVIGLVMWWAYLPPMLYDIAFVLVYMGALAIVVKGSGNGMGGRAVYLYFARPAFPRRARNAGISKDTSEVQA